MTFGEFKNDIKMRRIGKRDCKIDEWYFFSGIVEGKLVQLKGYKTWLQRYFVDGVDWSNCSDVTVKQFNQDLLKPFLCVLTSVSDLV